jgi:hypothetical protein
VVGSRLCARGRTAALRRGRWCLRMRRTCAHHGGTRIGRGNGTFFREVCMIWIIRTGGVGISSIRIRIRIRRGIKISGIRVGRIGTCRKRSRSWNRSKGSRRRVWILTLVWWVDFCTWNGGPRTRWR